MRRFSRARTEPGGTWGQRQDHHHLPEANPRNGGFKRCETSPNRQPDTFG